MRFNSSVALFSLADIPLIGNLDNGFVIGLTPAGVDLCRRLMKENVSEEEIRSVDTDLLDFLVQGAFFSSKRTAPKLQSAYLHVTQRCNLQCVGCYSFDDTRNKAEDASTSDMLALIQKLADAGVASLYISGGEPFLRSDLPQLVWHAKKTGINSVLIITNGTCLSKKALLDLAPFVDCISVSFDGCDSNSTAYIRGAQRFDQLVEAINAIKSIGIRAHIVPTMHRLNVDDLDKYAELAQALGVTMNYSLLSCECEPKSDLAALIPDDESLRKLARGLFQLDAPPSFQEGPPEINISVRTSCGVGSKEISVGADGTVFPCHMLQKADYAMGNLLVQPLEEIMQSDVAIRLRSLTVDRIEKCSNCRYALLCGGGCRARAVYAKGNLAGCDPYCAFSTSYYDQLGLVLASLL